MIQINLKKEVTKNGTFTKNNWYHCYEWLINYDYNREFFKTKLCVFLKPMVIVNQKVSQLCTELKKNQAN